MPKFFFHVRDGQSFPDREGSELPDVREARLQAVRMAGEMLRDDRGTFWDGEEWQMEVTDAAGMTLFTLDFMATEAPAVRPAR